MREPDEEGRGEFGLLELDVLDFDLGVVVAGQRDGRSLGRLDARRLGLDEVLLEEPELAAGELLQRRLDRDVDRSAAGPERALDDPERLGLAGPGEDDLAQLVGHAFVVVDVPGAGCAQMSVDRPRQMAIASDEDASMRKLCTNP